MAGAGRLEELQLSAEEAERLERALRDEKFRELFAEYAAELADPEQRRLYEEEVAALERERGVEVRFIHPAAGYVLRTSQDGSRRCYLNVCSNPQVGEPRARAEPGGQRWDLPYSLTPGREELGRGGRRRLVYDVVFHPAALRLAARSPRFRRLLSDTALEAVERHCAVQLDRANAALLRGAKYKGVPQAPVIRTPLPAAAPPAPGRPRSPPAAPPPARPAGPVTPRWSIRHRSYVDLQDYRCCRDSAPSPVPRELVVTVELPLLSSAAQAVLEIRGRELRLDSQRPAYRLRLRLPYDVRESAGRAAFCKAQRQLQVTLPVLPPPGPAPPPAPRGQRPEAPGEPPVAEAGGGAAPPPGPGVGEPARRLAEPSPPGSGDDLPAPSGSPEPAGDAVPRPPGSSPGRMAPPRGRGSPQAALCPPFQCRQDQASLTLLLHVPGIHPRSLRGQERLFVSEENVDGFLDTVLCPPVCSNSALESQPLIEVLDVSEDRIQIRLKQQEAGRSGRDGEEQGLSSAGGDPAGETHGDNLQTKAETNRPAAGTVEERAAETKQTSTALAAAETIGKVGCSSHRCLQPEPSDTGSAISGESRKKEPDLESAVAAGGGALAAGSDKQAELLLGGLGRAGGEGAGWAGGSQPSSGARPASPLLQEVDRDGNVRILRDHVTRCPLAFQNPLLYELD
ncbi:protein kintoun isoform X3 [Apus apus]|uniref:protein kintoun isoform X3 n=1 Tax=Apus apus TaxID=8895 RepID=UPI0021F83097|nr:protein kintoun isoform X3 [Apus apus]